MDRHILRCKLRGENPHGCQEKANLAQGSKSPIHRGCPHTTDACNHYGLGPTRKKTDFREGHQLNGRFEACTSEPSIRCRLLPHSRGRTRQSRKLFARASLRDLQFGPGPAYASHSAILPRRCGCPAEEVLKVLKWGLIRNFDKREKSGKT